MELQAFIEEALKQIMAGVANAGKQATELGGSLNPRQKTWKYGEGLYFDKATGAVLGNVEFDIAVTASNDTKSKGGIGVAIASVMLGAQGETAKSNQQVSRIKFSIPVVFPSTNTKSE